VRMGISSSMTRVGSLEHEQQTGGVNLYSTDVVSEFVASDLATCIPAHQSLHEVSVQKQNSRKGHLDATRHIQTRTVRSRRARARCDNDGRGEIEVR